jgi:hypothetical protein
MFTMMMALWNLDTQSRRSITAIENLMAMLVRIYVGSQVHHHLRAIGNSFAGRSAICCPVPWWTPRRPDVMNMTKIT